MKVYVQVDPMLHLIKADKKMIWTLVVNTMSLACRNITQRLSEIPSARDHVQEVLLRAVPIKSSGSFLDMKYMSIEVLDSGSRSLVQGRGGVLGYGHLICRRLVEKHSGQYTVTVLNHFKYATKIRFTIPYKCHPLGSTLCPTSLPSRSGLRHAHRSTEDLMKAYRCILSEAEREKERLYDGEEESESDNHSSSYSPPKSIHIEKRKILLIDGEAASRQFNMNVLERNGWVCHTISDITLIHTFTNLHELDCILISFNSSTAYGTIEKNIGNNNTLAKAKVFPGQNFGDTISSFALALKATGYDMAICLLVDNKNIKIGSSNNNSQKAFDCIIVKPVVSSLEILRRVTDSRTVGRLLWFHE